jgi:creatinine amidohydrolase/Fe(II)-dependent formamide hydrolase-like protein
MLSISRFRASRLQAVLGRLEKRIPEILLVPPIWTGVSAHHMDFPGRALVFRVLKNSFLFLRNCW